jgi:putrescine transport system permease protein
VKTTKLVERTFELCKSAVSFKNLATSLLTLVALILIVAPLIVVLRTSLSYQDFSIPPFSEIFSATRDNLITIKLNMQNYITILKDSYYMMTFLNSVELGGISTLLCLVLGFAMAYGIHNARDSTKSLLILLVSLSSCTSFLLRVYAWMNLLSVNGVINSLLMKAGIIDSPIRFVGNNYSVLLGLVFCYLPLMIMPIYTSLHKLDKSYMDAAYDLGAKPTSMFWKIVVPLAKQGVISGCILVFAASIGEFVIPELLGGADTNVLGRAIWNEFFVNLDWPMACALSVVMMTLMILPAFVFSGRLEKRR